MSAVASRAQLPSLRPMPMRQLQPGERHFGRCIQGRICAPATKMTGVMVVLASEEPGDAGTACQLAVYNMAPPGAGPRQVDRLFPEGTCLAVKEPYFKIFADGTAGIRVDCPSDIVFLGEGSPPAAAGGMAAPDETTAASGTGSMQRQAELALEACTDPETLRQRGNELFRDKEGTQALRCYARWLLLEPGSVPALVNAAAAHLELGHWEQAYTAARDAHRLDPSSSKARYRLARALLHLRCYGPARDHLKALRQQMPKDKSVADLLRSAEVLAAQGSGRFDMAGILTADRRPAQMADWVGPIEVFASPVAGRGLRTTRAVKAGELLLVEGALASAASPPHSFELHLDMSTRRMNLGSQQQLAGELLRLSGASALDRQRVLALSDDESPAAGVPTCAALTPFQTEEELWSALQAAQAEAADSPGPDMQRCLGVVRVNAWGTSGGGKSQDPALSWPRHAAGSGEESAVWALLCLANHSCEPNAHAVFMGGPCMLRASRDLPAGEELFVSYSEDALFQPLRRRRQTLEDWDFRCRCRRCLVEEELPAEAVERMEEIDVDLDASTHSPGRLRRSFRALNTMPPAVAAHSAAGLLAEVRASLEGLEAALGQAPSSTAGSGVRGAGSSEGAAGSGGQPCLPDWRRACVLPAYLLCIACAQMAGDINTTLQLQRACLRMVEAVRPGAMEHATLAAMHAVDAGACRRVSKLAAAKRKRPAQQEALARAVRAAKTRYGRELPEAAAIKLLDRLVENSLMAAGQR